MQINTIAILLMAGEGARFESSLPKQFHRLSGKKIYLHTLETFLASQLFSSIVLVAQKGWFEEIAKDLENYVDTPIHLIEGGSTRQESSYLATLYCSNLSPDLVLVHDAVRPFVSVEILKENLEAAKEFGACDTCILSTDTLVHAPDGEKIESIPNRKEWLRGQTPQTFQFPLLLESHRQGKGKNKTDDCSLVIEMGYDVKVVYGSERNLKITTDLDLVLAEQLLRSAPGKIKQIGSLQGKKIAVTGGTGGIGQEICALLEQEQAIPIVLSRGSMLYPTDLTSAKEVKNRFDEIFQEHGALDGLVNSIGCLIRGSVAKLSDEEIETQIQGNLMSVIYSCKYAPLKPGAHIVNIASSSYLRGQKECTIYSSAKAAVVNFSQGFAEERPNLYVNVICPQRTNTSLRWENFPGEPTESLIDPKRVANEVIALLTASLSGTVTTIRLQEQPSVCLS